MDRISPPLARAGAPPPLRLPPPPAGRWGARRCRWSRRRRRPVTAAAPRAPSSGRRGPAAPRVTQTRPPGPAAGRRAQGRAGGGEGREDGGTRVAFPKGDEQQGTKGTQADAQTPTSPRPPPAEPITAALPRGSALYSRPPFPLLPVLTSSSTTIWSHCAAVERRCATRTLVRPCASANSAPSTSFSAAAAGGRRRRRRRGQGRQRRVRVLSFPFAWRQCCALQAACRTCLGVQR